MSSSSADHVHSVTIDCWQNQRFRPLRATWSDPFSSGVPSFSNLLATQTAQSDEQKDEPTAMLPKGWEWQSEWMIDMQGTFGAVDSDGWAYASSFETLFEQSKTKCLVGEMGRLSLVRRRRWVRVRVAVSEEAIAHFEERIFWVSHLRQRLDSVLSSKEADYILIQQYEARRKLAHEHVLAAAETSLNDTISLLEGVCDKLEAMKSFLLERGQIEREYAKKLDALSTRWMYAGQPNTSAPSSPSSSSSSKSSSSAPSSPERSHTQQHSQGFFYVVSSANKGVANRVNEFSDMLSSSLPLDVEAVIQEVKNVRTDCLVEGPALRANLKARVEHLDLAYLTYKNALTESRVASSMENVRLATSLYSTSAAEETEEDGGEGVGGCEESTGQSGSKLDVFLSLNKYHLACGEADGALLVFAAFGAQQKREGRLTASRVAALLKATIKVFVHEQTRVWEEGVGELKKVSAARREGSPAVSRTSTSTGDESPGGGIAVGVEFATTERLPICPACSVTARRGKLKCAVAPGSNSIKNIANFAGSVAPEFLWKDMLVVVTFDASLLIYPYSDNDESSIKGEQFKAVTTAKAEEEETEAPPLAEWASQSPILVVSLLNCNVEPLLLLGQDAFVVRSKTKSSSAIAPFALLAENSTEAALWMRVISQPLADPTLDPPHASGGLALLKQHQIRLEEATTSFSGGGEICEGEEEKKAEEAL